MINKHKIRGKIVFEYGTRQKNKIPAALWNFSIFIQNQSIVLATKQSTPKIK